MPKNSGSKVSRPSITPAHLISALLERAVAELPNEVSQSQRSAGISLIQSLPMNRLRHKLCTSRACGNRPLMPIMAIADDIGEPQGWSQYVGCVRRWSMEELDTVSFGVTVEVNTGEISPPPPPRAPTRDAPTMDKSACEGCSFHCRGIPCGCPGDTAAKWGARIAA